MTIVGGVPEHFNLPWESASADLDGVEWRNFPDGSGAMARALAAKEIDVAVMLTTSTIRSITQGLRAKIVGTHVTSSLRWGIFVGAASSITSVDDIRGRSIAISRTGSGSHLIPLVDAQLRGWPVDDLEFVEVGTLEGARAALTEGRAEVFFWEQFMTQPSVDDGTFRRVGERLPPWPSFLVVAHDDWLQSHDPHELIRPVGQLCREFSASEATVDTIVTRFHLSAADARSWLRQTEWTCEPTVRRDRLEAARHHLRDAFGDEMAPVSQLVHPSCDVLDGAR